MEKKSLGRGLSALIPPQAQIEKSEERIANIPIEKIQQGKYQPRVGFKKEGMEELINSIKEKGVIQPVLIRKSDQGYELIAGERRLRAAKALGIDKIPAIIKEVTDVDMLTISLIENIQREDLNPMEEASAYQRFVSEFKFTQDEVSKILGKDRSTVANTLRLLGLPKKIQDFISENSITAGHGRALLSLPDEKEQVRVCTLVVKKGLSVRETEQIVVKRTKGKRRIEHTEDAPARALEDELRQRFGTRVRIIHGKKRGRIVIEYYSLEDMERIVRLIQGAT